MEIRSISKIELYDNLKKLVYTIADLSYVNDRFFCNNLINRLTRLSLNDVIDYFVVKINDLYVNKTLKKEDVLDLLKILTNIYPDKYPTLESLVNRLKWLKSMNLEHPVMPLSENHQLIIETFDSFNILIGTNFDAYYTGGSIGYIATNHPLERYHSDLDMYINEEQLLSLYDVVKKSEDFRFVSNMNEKAMNGHEFKIQYKDTPMSIGLFLFERNDNNEIILKDYYYNKDELYVNEQHLVSEYSLLLFSDNICTHKNISYKMQSLDTIYNSKKKSRPKDIYDANIIKDSIDLDIDSKLDVAKRNNYEVIDKYVKTSNVSKLDKILNKKNKPKTKKITFTKPVRKDGYINYALLITIVFVICSLGIYIGYSLIK